MQRSGWVQKMLAGFVIGIGCILPGVSGGVMAVSFGLYRPLLDAATGFFREPAKHLRFLLPVAVGGCAGIAAGAAGLNAAMARHASLMLFLFTGFILGGVPDLLREAEQAERFRPRWLWALLAGIALALPLSLTGAPGEPVQSLSRMQALLCGVLEGAGTVVPGISTSFVLLRLGWYQAYLQMLSSLAWEQLAFAAAGFALSAFGCLQGAKRLFDRYTGYAYYAVLGFLLVSVGLVFPGFSGRAWAEAALLAAGAVLARRLGTVNNKGVRK